MLYQDNYFTVNVKLNFVRDRLTVLMIKIKYLNLLQILIINSLNVKHQEKAHINWHFTCQLARMKTLKNNISEAYKVQVECLKDSESDSYDENDMEEKLNELVRLHKAMQEKLKTALYSHQIQILPLVPYK